jgi:hypothetical protein
MVELAFAADHRCHQSNHARALLKLSSRRHFPGCPSEQGTDAVGEPGDIHLPTT